MTRGTRQTIAEREAARVLETATHYGHLPPDYEFTTALQVYTRDAIARAVKTELDEERRRIRQAIKTLDDLTGEGDDLIPRREALACVRGRGRR